jgi:hypothetical protein
MRKKERFKYLDPKVITTKKYKVAKIKYFSKK